MKCAIETYRGFEIEFDTEKESFICYSTECDRDQEKKSYASAKKWVDDFIKDNQKFKKVLVCPMISHYATKEKFTLVGMRKDGAFIGENKDGVFQVSKYDEERYCIWSEMYDVVKENYQKMVEDSKKIRDRADQYLKENYKPITLKQYKETL